MRKSIVVLFAFLISISGSSQNLTLKSNEKDQSKKWISFQTESFSGKLKASTSTLTIKLSNNSSKHQKILGNIQLKDVSGKGTLLCTDVHQISPKSNTTIKLRSCNGQGKLGPFGVQTHYDSASEMKNQSLFLRNKKWLLTLCGEPIIFYTDL